MKYLYTLATLALLAIAPQADAFFTTNQEVMRFNDTTSLFIIDYNFGFGDKTFMPILAERNLGNTDSESLLGYEIVDEDGNISDVGETTALVIADADVTDDYRYATAANKSTAFRLYVLFETVADAPENDYHLQVTNLPFHRTNADITHYLNVHELSHYQTPEVEHND